ncbi:phage tail sheath family protein [Phormidesmis sp. 146-35]
MALEVGVNVIEVDGRASPSIQAAPTSVAAFLGLAERGVPNQAVRVTSMQQFQNRFGNYRSDSYLAYAVEGFFLNGGREAYINRIVGAGSVAALVTLNNIQPTPAPTLRVTAGALGQVMPGAWGNSLRVDVRAETATEFRLVIRYQDTPTSDFTEVETWTGLSMATDATNYVVNRINHPFSGSRYIVVTDLSGSTAANVENPAVVSNQALTGGTDTAPTAPDYIGNPAQKTGLYAFDTVQVQLVAIPDAHSLPATGRNSAVRAALDYCAGRGDCTVVGSAPDRGSPTGVIPRALSNYIQLESDYVNTITQYGSQFQANKVYGALYAGWIRVNDPIGVGPAPARFIPPDGHVMGVYARTEQERGIWKAPAGNAAQVRGALDVSATFTDTEHTALVKTAFVNGIRRLPGVGIIVAASRTLSTDTRWWFVNVRLLFNFVKSSLRDGLRFVRQEPHSEELRRQVKFNVVTPFLLGLWRQGAFGSDPPDQVFSVKCDGENNPPDEVNLGNFRLEVYLYPVKPAETIIIVVGQQSSGASANEG